MNSKTTRARQFIKGQPTFSQTNFFKLLNELDKMDEFFNTFRALPFWKRVLFGPKIINRYLVEPKPKSKA